MNLFFPSYCECVEVKGTMTTNKFGATTLIPAKAPVVLLCIAFA